MRDSDLPFGEYIRGKREQIGKTLRGFAGELDISAAYLHDIENGKRRAPEKLLGKMAELLGITETDEVHHLYDLAGVSQNGQHADINNYMNEVPAARAALRTAKDVNYTDEDWQKLIEISKKNKLR